MLSNVSPSMISTGVAIAGAIGTIIVVSGILKLRYWFTRQPVMQGGKNPGEVRPPIRTLLDNPDAVKYELKEMNVPKLTGWKLKFMVWLAYTRFGRDFFIPRVMSKSGLDRLGGVWLPDKPTYYPTPPTPPSDKDHTQSNKELIEKLVGSEVDGKDEGFRFPTVADYVRAYQSGVCTPTDVAEAVLKAIEDSNKMSPPLRAIVQTNRDVVLAMAEASTQRWKEGKTLSVIDGIPIAIKGEFRVEPYDLYGGACFIPHLAHGVPETALVQKLKDSGSVIIGIANLQEFGAGVLGSNPNHLHLTARNPYNPQHYPGGSSSGSAVCVAAGLCPIAIGTDGGGSIRIPCSLCGVVGLKITNRGVDHTGVMPLSASVGAVGPCCSSVLDAAITLDIISKETDGERKLISLEGVGETRLDGLNIGVYWEYFEHADPEIVQKCKATVSVLQSLGANVVEIKIPELEEIRVAHFLTITCEFLNSLSKDVDTNFDKITAESLMATSPASQIKATEFLNAQRQRTRAIEALKFFFNESKVDVIITPGTGCPAPAIDPASISHGISDGSATARIMKFSPLANVTGIPGLVLPVGYTKAGLPINLQVMGQWYQERVLLKVGWVLEKSGELPAIKKPQVFYDIIKTASE